jgi:hypothetical protein
VRVVRPAVRPALFLLSLALLLATATPAAWGQETPEPSGPTLSTSEVASMARDGDLARARRVDAHMIADWHEARGHEQWRNGLGDPRYTWALFKRQARQLRRYLLSQSETVRRFALVVHWRGVAQCESGGNWAIDTGNGYYGGLQFTTGTWRAYGGTGMPQDQPAWYQAQIADNVRTRSGLHHWPVCGRHYR